MQKNLYSTVFLVACMIGRPLFKLTARVLVAADQISLSEGSSANTAQYFPVTVGKELTGITGYGQRTR